jgi:hypothetical protein
MSSRGVVPMRMATSRLRLSWPRLLTLLWHAFHGCAGMPVVFVSDYLLMEAEPRVSGVVVGMVALPTCTWKLLYQVSPPVVPTCAYQLLSANGCCPCHQL